MHVIRHKVLIEGRSARQVAKELGISRRTVRKDLRQAGPQRVETQPRARPVWTKVQERVDALLTESAQWTGGKQQLTATRLHELLVAEGHRVGVTLVKEAVAEWKRARREVFVPLTYRPGDLAEVDFFEVLVDAETRLLMPWDKPRRTPRRLLYARSKMPSIRATNQDLHLSDPKVGS